MKSTTKALTLASAIALGGASGAAMAHYENHDYGCGGQMMNGYPMGSMMPMTQMQAMMQQNRALMERMVDEPDQNKRRELMQQNMQSMHGQMMGRQMNPGAGAGFAPEQMQQMLEMMNQRMDRMQQMMEQLQQNQAQ